MISHAMFFCDGNLLRLRLILTFHAFSSLRAFSTLRAMFDLITTIRNCTRYGAGIYVDVGLAMSRLRFGLFGPNSIELETHRNTLGALEKDN